MLKYPIAYEPAYTKEAFIFDLKRYIMNGSVSIKIGFMNRDNYALPVPMQLPKRGFLDLQ